MAKTITIKDDTWRRLTLLKLELNIRSFDSLFEHFLKKEKGGTKKKK